MNYKRDKVEIWSTYKTALVIREKKMCEEGDKRVEVKALVTTYLTLMEIGGNIQILKTIMQD